MLQTLANLPEHPESVPINLLIRVEGTPLSGEDDFDIFEFVRTVAVARIVMPASMVRLSAGREQMTDEAQALCFMAGANSIFAGDKLLTTSNPGVDHDTRLFERLGVEPMDGDGPGAGARSRNLSSAPPLATCPGPCARAGQAPCRRYPSSSARLYQVS